MVQLQNSKASTAVAFTVRRETDECCHSSEGDEPGSITVRTKVSKRTPCSLRGLEVTASNNHSAGCAIPLVVNSLLRPDLCCLLPGSTVECSCRPAETGRGRDFRLVGCLLVKWCAVFQRTSLVGGT
jgi:hypothetical protein